MNNNGQQQQEQGDDEQQGDDESDIVDNYQLALKEVKQHEQHQKQQQQCKQERRERGGGDESDDHHYQHYQHSLNEPSTMASASLTTTTTQTLSCLSTSSFSSTSSHPIIIATTTPTTNPERHTSISISISAEYIICQLFQANNLFEYLPLHSLFNLALSSKTISKVARDFISRLCKFSFNEVTEFRTFTFYTPNKIDFGYQPYPRDFFQQILVSLPLNITSIKFGFYFNIELPLSFKNLTNLKHFEI